MGDAYNLVHSLKPASFLACIHTCIHAYIHASRCYKPPSFFRGTDNSLRTSRHAKLTAHTLMIVHTLIVHIQALSVHTLTTHTLTVHIQTHEAYSEHAYSAHPNI